MFPYGAQYYRTPNPPEPEWEKDFAEMARQGFTIVKIWAMWSWMHVSDDGFDFDHFDRLFDLAERNGLKLVINTILENSPYWLTMRHPDARYEASDGQKFWPVARSNTPGGGWPGLCLDNPEVRSQAQKFLEALGRRYAASDTLLCYDVWNEVFFEPYWHHGFENRQFCYCSASKARFVEWLKRKYGSIENLSAAWYRRYSGWDQVYPPPYQGSYPDWLDWIKFRLENHRDQMRWRVATLRAVDSRHPLTSHGIGHTLGGMPTHLTDDFDIAPEVDQWGLSSFPFWGNQTACDHMRTLDLVRSASFAAGKRFWQNELQGGQSGSGLARSMTPRGIDTAFWNCTAFMCGASGLMYWQWRPELLGPESPGFGLCKTDGTPTDRTGAASWFARFMNERTELSEAKPVRGDTAILVLPESQLYAYIADGSTNAYVLDAAGLYRALWDRNVQADFAKLNNIADYKLAFLPFPMLIERDSAEKLREYVAGGGTLVSHACPAHFIDGGYCSFKIPGLGLDELFGAVEDETDFVASFDAVGRPRPVIEWNGGGIPCALYQERLIPTTGAVAARYADGAAAVVDNTHGRGKTRLIGTMLGSAFQESNLPAAADLIRSALEYAGIEQTVRVDDDQVKARLHRGGSGDFLWVLNTSGEVRTARIALATGVGRIRSVEALNEGIEVSPADGGVAVRMPARSGAVMRVGIT